MIAAVFFGDDGSVGIGRSNCDCTENRSSHRNAPCTRSAQERLGLKTGCKAEIRDCLLLQGWETRLRPLASHLRVSPLLAVYRLSLVAPLRPVRCHPCRRTASLLRTGALQER